MSLEEEKGYVRATIAHDPGEGAFDAGAYSFFGDMAPLDEGLGGALEEGLEAPPEEWAADGEGALEDDDDLPIEALMDEDEDEDLSLAALLRRQMLAKDVPAADASSSSAAASKAQQRQASTAHQLPHSLDANVNGLSSNKDHTQDEPLLPPLPPQPTMLGLLSHHTAKAALATPPDAATAVVAAAPAAAPVGRPSASMMTAADLEARMLSSANQQQESSGNTLLSMLKGKTASKQEKPAAPSEHHARRGVPPGFPTLPDALQQQHPASQQLPHAPLPGSGMPADLAAMGQYSNSQLGQTVSAGGMLGPYPQAPPVLQNGSSLDAFLLHQQQQQEGAQLLPPHVAGAAWQAGLPPHPPGARALPPPLPGHMSAIPGGPYSLPPPGHMGPGPLPGQPGSLGPVPPVLPPHGPIPPPPGGVPLMGPPLPPMGMGMPGMPGQQNQPGLPPPHLQQQPPLAGPIAPPPLPGQLLPPRGMLPPPPFPGMHAHPAGHPLQQQPPQQPPAGFKAMLPPPSEQQQQQPGAIPAVQQQQQAGHPRGLSPPRHLSSAAAWASRGSFPQQQQQQQPSAQQQQQQQRHSSPAALPGFGSGYDPGPAGSASAAVSPAALVHRLRMQGSELMSADEINYILRIQHMATHGGQPYLEDFYYQAFLHKYFGGRNSIVFAPSELRDLPDFDGQDGGSTLGGGCTEPRFADLAGLGKLVLSNIRTPKMLMDLTTGHGRAGGGGEGAAEAEEAQLKKSSGPTRPLEQEPMLAARIMIEDCMLLLSDVEDIDRMFAAAAAVAASGLPPPPGTPGFISPAMSSHLLRHRAALLGGIAASFRLPDAPTVPAEGVPAADALEGGSAFGDGVFVRIMALPKGRALVSKTLRLMFAAAPAAAAVASRSHQAAATENGDAAAAADGSSSTNLGLDVIWALLRNTDLAFGPPVAVKVTGEAERRMTDATVGLSAAAAEKIKRLTKPDEAVACLAACLVGLAAAADSNQLLPLFPAGRVPADASPDWLHSILSSLLLRASELGLGSFAASGNSVSLREGYGSSSSSKGNTDVSMEAEDAEAAAEDASNAAAAAAVAVRWSQLLEQLTELVMLHLWALIQLSQPTNAAAAAAGGGGGPAGSQLQPYVQKMACVPLIRVLMAHCTAKQQDQLKSYLSELKSH